MSLENQRAVDANFREHTERLETFLRGCGLRVMKNSPVRRQGDCLFDCLSMIWQNSLDHDNAMRQWVVQKLDEDTQQLGLDLGDASGLDPVSEVHGGRLIFEAILTDWATLTALQPWSLR